MGQCPWGSLEGKEVGLGRRPYAVMKTQQQTWLISWKALELTWPDRAVR